MRQSWKLLLLTGAAMISAMMVGASAASRGEDASTTYASPAVEAVGYAGLADGRHERPGSDRGFAAVRPAP